MQSFYRWENRILIVLSALSRIVLCNNSRDSYIDNTAEFRIGNGTVSEHQFAFDKV